MIIEIISKYLLFNFHIYLVYTCIRLLLHKNRLHLQDKTGYIKDMYGKSQNYGTFRLNIPGDFVKMCYSSSRGLDVPRKCPRGIGNSLVVR